ncbi:glycosyl hydrolase family 8 [Glaciihabitans sp. UYNi722]|uniref:glycosyl hydrolase family 8 n=1 Tax=Glaciihabitans sp. UYNi722 TaxID=3156344 RepID=UPI00339149F2
MTAAIVATVATAAVAWLAVGSPGLPHSQPMAVGRTDPSIVPTAIANTDPKALGEDFLDSWVSDGRVIRRDQGSDTVSEGQAYGLLIAVSVGSEKQVDSIWKWTKTHLLRDDGLLAWRWSGGKIVDQQPASDADLDTSRALVLAGSKFDRPDLTKAGMTMAGEIADRLTVETSLGRILLPGLWAAQSEPYAYNPSYASPVAFAVLATATKDARWDEVAKGTQAVTDKLLQATALPPNWAQVHADGQVDAMPGPAGVGDAVSYGYDAERLALRYAESCTPADEARAALLFPTLDRTKTLTAVLDLGGGSLTTDRHPLAYAARAASAAAAGKDADANDDLARVVTLSNSTPTYYGKAWTALSMSMLRQKTLGGCAPLAGGTR